MAKRDKPIDLNTGDEQELMRIEGIDGTRARLILEYRREHGPFESWEAFEQVLGIGPTLVEKAMEMAVLGGEGGARSGGGRRGSRPPEQQARGEAGEERERGGAAGIGSQGEGAATDEELEETILSASEVLAALAQLDLESALAYEAAAELAGDAEIARQLREFGQDHRRHVERLTRALEAEGDEALAPPPDKATGMLAELARLSGPLGPGPLAMSLLANEQLTNLSYEDALAYEWDGERERMLEAFRSDEERHMRWLSDHYEEMERSSPEEQQPGAAE